MTKPTGLFRAAGASRERSPAIDPAAFDPAQVEAFLREQGERAVAWFHFDH